MKILNLYCGIGGNRKLWGDDHEITAVEYNQEIADIYKKFFPNDIVLVCDAHQYLLEHFREFDFIWASPPCQNNSKARFWYSRNSTRCLPKYPDLTLYQYKLFLDKFYDGKYVIENVVPYYKFLIFPTITIGHNVFWTNFKVSKMMKVPEISKLFKRNTKEEILAISNYLGIFLDKTVYSNSNSPTQVLRNCVHPEVGLYVFKQAFVQKPSFNFTK